MDGLCHYFQQLLLDTTCLTPLLSAALRTPTLSLKISLASSEKACIGTSSLESTAYQAL